MRPSKARKRRGFSAGLHKIPTMAARFSLGKSEASTGTQSGVLPYPSDSPRPRAFGLVGLGRNGADLRQGALIRLIFSGFTSQRATPPPNRGGVCFHVTADSPGWLSGGLCRLSAAGRERATRRPPQPCTRPQAGRRGGSRCTRMSARSALPRRRPQP